VNQFSLSEAAKHISGKLAFHYFFKLLPEDIAERHQSFGVKAARNNRSVGKYGYLT
jgi:hypothetical protein